jgi:hypothetical protein
MTSNPKRAQALEKFAHYITAFIIFTKGLDKIETPGKTGFAILFLVLGALIVLGTLFHHQAEKFFKHFKHFKAYVFFFEAVVMALVGYMYAKEGKHFIQYFCFASSAIFIIAVIIHLKKVKTVEH